MINFAGLIIVLLFHDQQMMVTIIFSDGHNNIMKLDLHIYKKTKDS
jgi:hypothetical protein